LKQNESNLRDGRLDSSTISMDDILYSPSDVTWNYWIDAGPYHAREVFDSSIQTVRWFDTIGPPKGITGKWMVFFSKENHCHDYAWNCILGGYFRGDLPGVRSIKTSTAKDNPRATSKDTGVIILYCDNSENTDHIYSVGNTIIKFMRKYKLTPTPSWSGHIHYKTDDQTFLGTRATGQMRNHTCKLLFNDPFDDSTEPVSVEQKWKFASHKAALPEIYEHRKSGPVNMETMFTQKL